jgi:hypothetical protein
MSVAATVSVGLRQGRNRDLKRVRCGGVCFVDVSSIVIVAAAACLAGFVQGMTGFGSVLAALPLLSIALGVRAAIPLACLLAFCINILLLPGLRKNVQLRPLAVLLLCSIPGMALGAWFLGRAPDAVLKTVIGLIVVYMAVSSRKPPKAECAPKGWLTMTAGFASGFLGVCTGAGGPPVLIWAARQPWSARMLKATIVGFFLVSGVGIVAVQACSGLITSNVLMLFAVLLPPLVLGVWLGGFCFVRMNEIVFRRVFCLLLGVLGGTLLALSAPELLDFI